MKYLKFLTFLIVSFCLFNHTAFAQLDKIPVGKKLGEPQKVEEEKPVVLTDSIAVKALVEKNNEFITNIPSEKVYLHFDKPYYAVGDTIWFKAYVTSVQHIPSPLSKIVYVDVISEKDSLMESIKLPAINSTAHGSIPLNNLTYKQGNYRIRAYTKWMLNFNESYFFHKTLPVGNSINKDVITHVNFNSDRSDKSVKIKATLEFRDEQNMPLVNKRVNWEALIDFDRAGRGRGTTNAQGVLAVEFNSSSDVDLSRGKLVTNIELDNRTVETTFPLEKAAPKKDVQFFPEGGDLVDGIPTVVAFKAIQTDGLGVSASGEIVDSKGTSIAQVESQHVGMGKFSMTPKLGETYFAKLNFPDGSSATYNLPKVEAEGVGLSVDGKDPENLKISIKINPAFLAKHQNKGFYVVGRNGGIVYYAAQSGIRNTEFTSTIPKMNFPTGIVQLSVLASTGQTLAERLVFVHRPDTLNMQLTSDKQSYGPREAVKMKLDIGNTAQDSSLGNFSVSVIDETKVPVNEDKETTIWSSILLSSEVQGYIEKPNYYFHDVNEKKLDDLDLLLMTQGYRKYKYSDIVLDKMPNITMFPEQSLAVSGTIRRADGLPLANGRLLLQIPEKSFYKDGTTDDQGRFEFTNLAFEDSLQVVVNARNNLNSENLMIMVDGEPFPSIVQNINEADELLNIDSALQTYLKNNRMMNSTGFLLREVAIEGRQARKPSHRDHAALTGLSMQPDYTIQGSNLGGCNNLLNCVSGMMGLTYVDNMLYLSTVYNSGGRVPVEIYVNGMPVDVTYLYGVEPTMVESIEIFKDDGLTGINQRSNTMGVVVVNMKEVKTEKLTAQQIKELFPPSNMLTFNPKGFAEERQFYVPKYSGPRTSMQSQDLRTTIHWNPMLLTDQNGQAEFEYFTADDKGTYRVVVEGLDENGSLGRRVYRFQVE